MLFNHAGSACYGRQSTVKLQSGLEQRGCARHSNYG